MSGFLVLKPGVGSSSRAAKSVKRWFALLPDFVLYAFCTELDERAMTATPLPGFPCRLCTAAALFSNST